METKGSYPLAALDSDQRKKLRDMELQFNQETNQSVVLIAYEDKSIG